MPSAKLFVGDARRMGEVPDGSVHLVVTSPPYWDLKDYGVAGQIGCGQTLHEYLGAIDGVWRECRRVLCDSGRLCINIGDQFARASLYGRYRVIPLHAEVIGQCCALGLDYLGAIVWQKKTTVETTGGAVVMGSYPYPPNGIVELDHEYILICRVPGPARTVSREVKEQAALSREEWKQLFSGHWSFAGERKRGHEAPFPEELPRRLVRMFSFPGDTVLDPFLGTGTTAAVALALGRNAVGYDVSEEYAKAAAERCRGQGLFVQVSLERAAGGAAEPPTGSYQPRIPDLAPAAPAREPGPELHVVQSANQDGTLLLDDGRCVAFLGVRITKPAETLAYLRQRVVGRRVILKEAPAETGSSRIAARVYLKNRIFVNAYLLKAGFAEPAEPPPAATLPPVGPAAV
jgi:DNA modification methylase